MRRSIAVLAIALGLCGGVAHPARADFEAGYKAYRDGNYVAAMSNFRPLAEGGDARSQFYVGTLYLDGRSVPRDPRIAASWFEMAARRGDVDAAFALGFLRYYGAGEGEVAVTADPVAAAPWFVQAAKYGNAQAAYLIGHMYRTGVGAAADPVAARYWLGVSADAGQLQAQSELAVLLADQPGFNNALESYKWFELAARAGYPGAARNRDVVAGRLNAAEIQQATAQANTWRPRIEAIGSQPPTADAAGGLSPGK
jgi:TPR repeat protein